MNHPIMSSANGKARYNEMVQAADNYRRVKQLKQGESSQPSYLTRFADFLTSLFSKAGNSKTADALAQTS